MDYCEIAWEAAPFRGDRFEDLWIPIAEKVLDYGAVGHSFLRSDDDPRLFTQLSYWNDRLGWDRYWYSADVIAARERGSGIYAVPVVPQWGRVVDLGHRGEDPDVYGEHEAEEAAAS